MEDSVSIQLKNGVAEPAAGPPRPNPEVVADAKRRTFTAEYKPRIIKAAEAAKSSSGGVGALLRREGLFSSHLTTWRQERQASLLRALAPKTRGPKSKRDPQVEELLKLRQENQRLIESLRLAGIVIDVQKKWARCWGGSCRWRTPRRRADGRRAGAGFDGRDPVRL